MKPLTKKEQAAIKRATIDKVFVACMHILENSQLYGTSLWPKNGFIVGSFPEKNSRGNPKLDVICIKPLITDEYNSWVRFNLWNKSESRAFKQCKQLKLIFDQTTYDGIYFTDKWPLRKDYLGGHDHETHIMGMHDFDFIIQD